MIDEEGGSDGRDQQLDCALAPVGGPVTLGVHPWGLGAIAASDTRVGNQPGKALRRREYAGRASKAGSPECRAAASPRARGVTIKDVAKEVREAQATLDEKNQALAAYDELFGGGATAMTGLLRMAGKADLAAKVKPSTRRPGQTVSDAGDPAPAGAAGAGTGDK